VIVTAVRRISIVSAFFACLMAVTSANAKDTPVPDGNDPQKCDYVNYHHSEAKNTGGAGVCASDCDCDGTRSCTNGTCAGTARPAKLTAEICNSKDYHYQEKWTAAGQLRPVAGKCSGDCECDGQRTCVSGQCTGTAR
jgi:hypothetical protein